MNFSEVFTSELFTAGIFTSELFTLWVFTSDSVEVVVELVVSYAFKVFYVVDNCDFCQLDPFPARIKNQEQRQRN